MKSSLFVTLFLTDCFLALAQVQLKLFHRIYHPFGIQLDYSPRGDIILSQSGPTFLPHLVAPHDFLHFAESVHDLEGTLYQVAIQRVSDAQDSQWDFSSVKACHILSHTSDHLVLHLTDQGTPFDLDYFVQPTPHDGSCLDSVSLEALTLPTFPNTTVSLRLSGFPPQPILRMPPPLTPEGEPVQPVPEKTFLQKYWIILIGIFMLIVLGGGPDEEQGARRAGN